MLGVPTKGQCQGLLSTAGKMLTPFSLHKVDKNRASVAFKFGGSERL